MVKFKVRKMALFTKPFQRLINAASTKSCRDLARVTLASVLLNLNGPVSSSFKFNFAPWINNNKKVPCSKKCSQTKLSLETIPWGILKYPAVSNLVQFRNFFSFKQYSLLKLMSLLQRNLTHQYVAKERDTSNSRYKIKTSDFTKVVLYIILFCSCIPGHAALSSIIHCKPTPMYVLV